MNVPGHIEGCEILSEEVSQYFGLTFAFITTIVILPIHNKIDLAPNLIVFTLDFKLMTVRDSAHKYIQQLYRTNLIFYFNTLHQKQMESLFKRCQINAIEFFSAHFKKTALPPPEDVGPALYSGHSDHVSGSRVAKIVTLLTTKL